MVSRHPATEISDRCGVQLFQYECSSPGKSSSHHHLHCIIFDATLTHIRWESAYVNNDPDKENDSRTYKTLVDVYKKVLEDLHPKNRLIQESVTLERSGSVLACTTIFEVCHFQRCTKDTARKSKGYYRGLHLKIKSMLVYCTVDRSDYPAVKKGSLMGTTKGSVQGRRRDQQDSQFEATQANSAVGHFGHIEFPTQTLAVIYRRPLFT